MHSNVKFVRREEDIKVNIIRRVVGGITPRTKFLQMTFASGPVFITSCRTGDQQYSRLGNRIIQISK